MYLLNNETITSGMWLCFERIPAIENDGVDKQQFIVKIDKSVGTLFSFYIGNNYKIISRSSIKNGVYTIHKDFFNSETVSYHVYICSRGDVPLIKRLFYKHLNK